MNATTPTVQIRTSAIRPALSLVRFPEDDDDCRWIGSLSLFLIGSAPLPAWVLFRPVRRDAPFLNCHGPFPSWTARLSSPPSRGTPLRKIDLLSKLIFELVLPIACWPGFFASGSSVAWLRHAVTVVAEGGAASRSFLIFRRRVCAGRYFCSFVHDIL